MEMDFKQNDDLENLKEFTFIYRSIQAVSFIKSNPLVLPLNSSKTDHLILTRGYIFNILKMFFSGCCLSYNSDEQIIGDDMMEILF